MSGHNVGASSNTRLRGASLAARGEYPRERPGAPEHEPRSPRARAQGTVAIGCGALTAGSRAACKDRRTTHFTLCGALKPNENVASRSNCRTSCGGREARKFKPRHPESY
jgi:hypothetical protein